MKYVSESVGLVMRNHKQTIWLECLEPPVPLYKLDGVTFYNVYLTQQVAPTELNHLNHVLINVIVLKTITRNHVQQTLLSLFTAYVAALHKTYM